MNDLFLTLAQAPGRARPASSLPRVLPDGSRNGDPAAAAQGQARQPVQRVGRDRVRRARSAGGSATEGRGVATIIEMVTMTRLDCVLGSAALIRAALSEAAHHVAHRSAFGAPLADAPADADGDRRPRAGVGGGHRAGAAAGRAPSTATSARSCGSPCPRRSTWCASGRPTVVAEALECLGGNGYVEDSGLPRLLPRGAAQLDLGGLGQRHRAGRAARGHPRARRRGGGARRDGRRGGRGHVVRPRRCGSCAPSCAAASRAGRGGWRSCWRCACRAVLLLRYAPDDVASAFVSSRFLPDGPVAHGGHAARSNTADRGPSSPASPRRS